VPYQHSTGLNFPDESIKSNQPDATQQRSVLNLGRIGNRHRQQFRPRHPASLDFEVDTAHVPPQFQLCDISVGAQRHLLLFTARQLQLLSRALCWYVDGTFNVVKSPFTQLFVRCDDDVKQLPLAFLLMSSKRASDYRAVLPVRFSTSEAIEL